MEALLSWIRYSPMQPPLDMSGRWSSRSITTIAIQLLHCTQLYAFLRTFLYAINPQFVYYTSSYWVVRMRGGCIGYGVECGVPILHWQCPNIQIESITTIAIQLLHCTQLYAFLKTFLYAIDPQFVYWDIANVKLALLL
jgi:hypothetical protein